MYVTLITLNPFFALVLNEIRLATTILANLPIIVIFLGSEFSC